MLEYQVTPDYESLLANLRRKGTPKRVHYIELFWDVEIGQQIIERYNIAEGLDTNDPNFLRHLWIKLHRFLGYDYVPVGLDFQKGLNFSACISAQDTADLEHQSGRQWLDENRGPIQTWEDFEKFPWPDKNDIKTDSIEWFEKYVPDDMCLSAGCHNVFEFVTWLMGYEKLCYALYDEPDLIDALFEKIGQMLYDWCEQLVQFNRIKLFLGGDDMGYKTATMIPAKILKEKALVWHKKLAELCHSQDRIYCLHACGNLEEIMEDLIDYVKLDGKHSFEDTIEPVTLAKERWGDRISLLGGIDVDFLTRADIDQVRKRVRETLDICQPGGGYCLGTGNSVANYIPVDNYLAMLDEGRRYSS